MCGKICFPNVSGEKLSDVLGKPSLLTIRATGHRAQSPVIYRPDVMLRVGRHDYRRRPPTADGIRNSSARGATEPPLQLAVIDAESMGDFFRTRS